MQILNTIIEKKKIEVKQIQKIKYDKLQQNTNNFIDSLQKIRPAVIAELKKKSPSEGLICDNFNPVERAKLYEKGGARAISR